eukprot:m.276222 g.276222  ORF g.276222 m.276222 type:complete len:56 (-) comp17696_c0_seq12:306-473(-)
MIHMSAGAVSGSRHAEATALSQQGGSLPEQHQKDAVYDVCETGRTQVVHKLEQTR